MYNKYKICLPENFFSMLNNKFRPSYASQAKKSELDMAVGVPVIF